MPRQHQWSASAPAKVILFGEHAVNRAQPAIATAVDLRTRCTLTARGDELFVLRVGDRTERLSRMEVLALGDSVDAARHGGDVEAIQQLASAHFFAPTCYVLALFLRAHPLFGLDVWWESVIPMGSGLGSGAAASSALVLALCRAAPITLGAAERAQLAWQGDVVAHGGVASGLDSAAATLGGLVLYTVAEGPRALPVRGPLPLVIGDTGVRANTAEVNGRVRAWLSDHAEEGSHLFAAMGSVARSALEALAAGDLDTVGLLMNENQALLARLGVSCPEIERLTAAALGAGALGAKLSGSGAGGIVLALTAPGAQQAVAGAIEAAGGRAMITSGAGRGAHAEGA